MITSIKKKYARNNYFHNVLYLSEAKGMDIIMKRILFCLQTLVRGGVEKELMVISKLLIKKKCRITVVILYNSNNDLVCELEEAGIKVIDLEIDSGYYCAGNKEMFKRRLRSGHILEALVFALKFLIKIGCPETNISLRNIQSIAEKFDYAICYHIHSPIMVKFTMEKVIAKCKLAWIHNDFRSTGYRPDKILNLLSKYSEIIAVSKQVKNEFLELCPSLSEKTKVIYNILDIEHIIKSSYEEINDSSFVERNSFSILTIGRLTEQKGIDIAVGACAQLVNEGYKIHWYVIGEGEEYENLRSRIKVLKLESFFYLLGAKENPYPYLRKCDLYVQPSRHEGYGLAIAEARILCKPIISTDFAGALEQLENGKTGIIVEPNNSSALVNAVKEMMIPEYREMLSENLKNTVSYDNDIQKIYNCFKI